MAANTDTLGSGPQIIKDDDKQIAACRKMRNWLLSELIDCRQENERLREVAGKLDLLRLADWVENVRGTEDDWEWPKDIRGLHAALEEGSQDEQ